MTRIIIAIAIAICVAVIFAWASLASAVFQWASAPDDTDEETVRLMSIFEVREDPRVTDARRVAEGWDRFDHGKETRL